MIRGWAGKLKRRAARLGRRFQACALILMYHRIAELATDPQLLAVSPGHFAEHLEVLRRYGRPMALAELVGAVRKGRAPRRAVVLTFDDGYADNLYGAKPLLERYEVPATFFIATGYLGADREFWWDDLERVLLRPGRLPERLRVRLRDRSYEWQLDESGPDDGTDPERHRDWHVERPEDPGPRQRVYRALYGLLHPLPEVERRAALDDVTAWAGLETTARPTHRGLSAPEVARLEIAGLLEVGAHTVSHPVLPTLSAAEQMEEIRGSKARLEAILGHPVTSFAYPHGSSTTETVTMVRKAGFACGCSSRPDVVRARDDAFQLPRVVVRDVDGDGFARQIRWWLAV